MQEYATPTPKVPALSRTWQVETTYRERGVVTGHSSHTVTLDKRSGKLEGFIDGEPADLERAVKLVHYADSRRVLSQVVPFPPSMARCLGLVSA